MKTSYKIEHLTKTDTFNLLKSEPFAVATISLGHIPHLGKLVVKQHQCLRCN